MFFFARSRQWPWDSSASSAQYIFFSCWSFSKLMCGSRYSTTVSPRAQYICVLGTSILPITRPLSSSYLLLRNLQPPHPPRSGRPLCGEDNRLQSSLVSRPCCRLHCHPKATPLLGAKKENGVSSGFPDAAAVSPRQSAHYLPSRCKQRIPCRTCFSRGHQG